MSESKLLTSLHLTYLLTSQLTVTLLILTFRQVRVKQCIRSRFFERLFCVSIEFPLACYQQAGRVWYTLAEHYGERIRCFKPAPISTNWCYHHMSDKWRSINGTAHLCVIPTWDNRGQLWKGHQKQNILTKIMSINRFFIVRTLRSVQKYIFIHQNKGFAVYWLQWHYKLQHLFCGALYNQWKFKKRAVPLTFSQMMLCLIARNYTETDFKTLDSGPLVLVVVFLFYKFFCQKFEFQSFTDCCKNWRGCKSSKLTKKSSTLTSRGKIYQIIFYNK